MSTLDHKLEPEVTAVRRLEVITGLGGGASSPRISRRGIVEETLVPGAVVSDGSSPAWAYAAASVHMAPTSAPTGGEYGEQGAAVRAGSCGNGVAVASGA